MTVFRGFKGAKLVEVEAELVQEVLGCRAQGSTVRLRLWGLGTRRKGNPKLYAL